MKKQTTKINPLRRHKHAQLWFCRVDGKNKYLGNKDTTEAEAMEMHQKLLTDAKVDELLLSPSSSDEPLDSLLQYYLRHGGAINGKKNWTDRIRYCQLFKKQFGKWTIEAVRPYQIEKFVQEQENWNDTTKGNFCKHMNAAFVWLMKQRVIKFNPMFGVKRPQARTRGVEYVITPHEYEKLLPLVKETYRPIVELLWHTGARPDEILSATKEEFRPDDRVIRKIHHKTEHKGRIRDIPL